MNQPPRNPKEDVADHQRMILAVLISLGIMLGYELFFAERFAPPPPAEAAQQAAIEVAPPTVAEERPREEVLQGDARRIPVKGEKVSGSISLKGLRIDDLTLNDHYVTVEREEHVPLLIPSGAPHAFYAENGWMAARGDIAVPNADTAWTLASGSAKALESNGPPVVMQWDNGQGVMFEREITVDDNFLFTIVQRILNYGDTALSFNAYHLVARAGGPRDFSGLYTLHEGPVAQLGNEMAEPSYSDLKDGDKVEEENVTGWAGITDKYWMVTMLPEPGRAFNARIVGQPSETAPPHYQADIVDKTVTVEPGGRAENKTYLYAGVKDLSVMRAYEKLYGFNRIENALDFGIWYLITKPFYYVFHFLVGLFGSAAAAILAMTVLVRGALFPLATKSYVAMAKMKQMAPLLKELQAKHAGDKAKLQMELFELYKRENANPFSGCWPMIVQVPIFFALYKVILISVDLRHAPFWGWIKDMSAPDPTSVFNLFGLLPYELPSVLLIGGWPVIFCLTMIVQKRLSPPMPDPVQEKLQGYFPYFITVMLAHFASGLVIYWAWSNTLAVLQQYYILRRYGGEKVSLIRGHHSRRSPKKKKGKQDAAEAEDA